MEAPKISFKTVVKTAILAMLGGQLAAAICGLVAGLFVMLLWNWLVPGLFGLPAVSFWKGWGLFVLASILFKK